MAVKAWGRLFKLFFFIFHFVVITYTYYSSNDSQVFGISTDLLKHKSKTGNRVLNECHSDMSVPRGFSASLYVSWKMSKPCGVISSCRTNGEIRCVQSTRNKNSIFDNVMTSFLCSRVSSGKSREFVPTGATYPFVVFTKNQQSLINKSHHETWAWNWFTRLHNFRFVYCDCLICKNIKNHLNLLYFIM